MERFYGFMMFSSWIEKLVVWLLSAGILELLIRYNEFVTSLIGKGIHSLFVIVLLFWLVLFAFLWLLTD